METYQPMTSANIVSIQQISNKDHDELIKHYKHYQNMLLQVTAKNRSVLLRRIYNKHNFDLAQLEMIKDGTIQRVTSKTLKNTHSVLTSSVNRISPVRLLLDSIDGEEAYTVRSKLKTLSRNLTYMEEETGQQAGYIGFPFLQGHVTSSFFVRGPLVLFPISLEHSRQKGGWYIHLANRRPILNGALIASLRKKGNYNLPEDYEELFDEVIEDIANAPDDSEEYFFDRIYRWIKKMVPIDMTKNQLETVLLPELDRESLDQMVSQSLHLVNYKIIGNFPQADDQIYKDYNYLIKDASRRWPGVVGSLLGVELDVKETERDNESDGDGTVDLDNISDDKINTVLKSDSSQDEIIVCSKKHDLLVVRGPPGTGKSQVIVNLIADALTNDKKVLVVCQKRAALEVVRQRLEEVALDKYVVFLAKEIDDRTLMYRQLYDIIMEEPDGRPLKWVIHNISQDIDSCVQYLSKLGAALRKEHFDGATAHKIYSKADSSYKPVLDLSKKNLEVTWSSLDAFVEKIDNIEKLFKKLENENHPWFERKDFSGFGLVEGNQLNNLLEELLSLHPECLLAKSAVEQGHLKSHFDEYLHHSFALKQTTVDFSGFGSANARVLESLLEELLSLHPECLLAKSAVEQAQMERCLNGYLNNNGFLKRRKRKEYDFQIRQILGVTDVGKNFVEQNLDRLKKGIKFWETISAMLCRFDVDEHAELRQEVSGSDTVPTLRQLKKTAQAHQLQHTAADGIRKTLGVTDVDENFVAQNAGRVRKGIKFWETMSKLLEYFDSNGQRRLERKMKNPGAFISVLRDMKEFLDIDELQDFDQKKTEYQTDIWWILKQAKKHMKPNDNWTRKIKEEIYFHWLAQIEQENPILKGSHVNEYQRKTSDLVRLMEKKRQAVKESIQFEIEGAIHPDNMYYKRSEKARTWRDFAGELRKKRKIRPVRKMFENYASRMFKVAPCWLASPESVSKIFPMQRNLFDLVIVDEASQLAVERAIPFLYRANHVVVAGDEKQLPPFDLFQVIEDDEDDMPEERSLLELSRNKFRTFPLLWHYRSKYQDLINFSNQAFYNGMLNVAPNVDKDPKNPPVRWVECNGRWENNTNREEARTVVRELKNVWTMSWKNTGKLPSVGVITFNEPQQDLIKDEVDRMLDADPEFMELHTTTRKNRKDSWLFVKNIENVQGDERDIVIFSVGYARDADGLFAQNFGSLSKKGGENRLNVAVTRARQEMIIVCSVSPTDIKPTSRNDGPRRLRQFLQYAKATASQDGDTQKAVLKEINPNMDRVKRTRVQEFDSDFEVQVFKGLERRGYAIDSQVGHSGYVIDLAICHPHDPNRYILGIECDGATFHSAKSVKERDVMRQKFLESKGWNITRIWSRNWWKSPDRELDRIDAVIKDILSKESQL